MNRTSKDIKRLNAKMEKLAKVEMRKASNSALNKTAARIKSRLVKQVATETKLQQKHIRKRVFIKKSSFKTLFARITAYRRDMPLISTGNARQNKKGVRAAKQQHSSAFINNVNGRAHVLRRKSKARYPLELLKIAVVKIVDKFTRPIAQKIMKEDYPKLLRQEVEYRIKKLSGKI